MTTQSRDFEAPKGARCSEHPDRPARYRCPRCGRYACAFCWDESTSRCRLCASGDSLKAAVRLPFEDGSQPFISRVIATLASAFNPQETARCFSACEPTLALRFLLISALPLSLATGVIPHTRTLVFGPGLQVDFVGQVSGSEIALDILRAMLFQLLFDGIVITALVLPFASLAKSYGNIQSATGAIGTVFYRYWLIPGAMLISYLAFWVLPDARIGIFAEFVISVLALYFIVRAMWLTARLTYSVGTVWSIAVVGVPWIIVLLVIALVLPLLASSLGITPEEALKQYEKTAI
jgi:hypothetical protein